MNRTKIDSDKVKKRSYIASRGESGERDWSLKRN